MIIGWVASMSGVLTPHAWLDSDSASVCLPPKTGRWMHTCCLLSLGSAMRKLNVDCVLLMIVYIIIIYYYTYFDFEYL